MSIPLTSFVANVNPTNTVLLFGSGATIPSGAPSVATIVSNFERDFKVQADGLGLADYAGLLEIRINDRSKIIESLRKLFIDLRPTGGMLNLSLYSWKSIFTTNYDRLIESAYKSREAALEIFHSNFDFKGSSSPIATKLFKLHGTIECDVSDGHKSRLILSDGDYRLSEEFREKLYTRLRADVDEGTLLIIGHSLADPDINKILDKCIELNQEAGHNGRILVLSYSVDENRAALLERRGIRVAFGGIDDFFAHLAKRNDILSQSGVVNSNIFLSGHPILAPTTRDVAHILKSKQANISSMFNGWPADYPEISEGFTFTRSNISRAVKSLNDGKLAIVVLGAAGVGKTTACRQILTSLSQENFICFEHESRHALDAKQWINVSERLEKESKKAVLFIDEAHSHLGEINVILDSLALRSDSDYPLRVVLASNRGSWKRRSKSPALFRLGREFVLSKLDSDEIDNLLLLTEQKAQIRALVEKGFLGFSRHERRRRLSQRCEADFFVCLKNIFASESFDDIILREYAALDEPNQAVYKLVAILETSGIIVHRQLVMRLLGMPSSDISAVLSDLIDIVIERVLREREGVFTWETRHQVIAGIISKYKFRDQTALLALLRRVIDGLNPTHDVEVRSLRDLCSLDSGIKQFSDLNVQNELLRRMMSVAPGERVPRHRLVRNLIELGDYEQAASEIRIFEQDFGKEGPIARYRISLQIARAIHSPGIQNQDRIKILEDASEEASRAIARFKLNKSVFYVFCEVGLAIQDMTGERRVFDIAIAALKAAESRLGDPEVAKRLSEFERAASYAEHNAQLGSYE